MPARINALTRCHASESWHPENKKMDHSIAALIAKTLDTSFRWYDIK